MEGGPLSFHPAGLSYAKGRKVKVSQLYWGWKAFSFFPSKRAGYPSLLTHLNPPNPSHSFEPSQSISSRPPKQLSWNHSEESVAVGILLGAPAYIGRSLCDLLRVGWAQAGVFSPPGDLEF